MIAVERDDVGVGRLFEGDGPVGSPHEAGCGEGFDEAFDLRDGVGVGVWFGGERPDVRDFDEDSGVACEGEQELELFRLMERAVGHMVDDDGEVGVLFEEWCEIWHAGDWCEDGHRDFELSAAAPEGQHKWAANPVVLR